MIKLRGKIDYTQNENESKEGYSVQVSLITVSSDQQETVEKRATLAKEDGTFSFEVPPSEYIVRPTILYNKKKFNVLPRERRVKIENEPALDVDFSREKLTIKGKIKLFEGNNPEFLKDTKIILKNANGNLMDTRDWEALQPQGNFEFEDLFDEGYIVELQNERLCFNTKVIKTDEASGSVVFKQTGVFISYKSEIDLEVDIVSSRGDQDQIRLPRGDKRLCLGYVDEITGTISDNYLLKKDMNNFKFDPNSDKKLVFVVSKIKASASLTVDLNQLKKIYPEGISNENLLKKISMNIVDKKSGNQLETTTQAQDGVIKYTFYSEKNREVEVTPTIIDENLSKRLVILQKAMTLRVGTGYKKNLQSQPFEVTIGKRIFFEVDKEIADVEVAIKRTKSKDGYFEDFKTKLVDLKPGEFGTFNGNFDYDIEMKREGYELGIEKREREDGDLVFAITTLEISKLVIKIRGENGKPNKGVTVYITSAERGKVMKIVAQTDKDGVISKQIHKGRYYVKAVLKEYEFDPPQKTFGIEEGETYTLDIVAKRTQYSAYGAGKLPLNYQRFTFLFFFEMFYLFLA